jgi:uncharacterized damage-inducible protein DinB
MREAYLFNALEKSRERIVKLTENLSAEQVGAVPAGFNNSILWHLGHILTVADGLMYGLTGQEGKLPASYKSCFGNGTKPADWTEGVPSLSTILSELKEQPAELRASFEGKFADAAKPNFFKAETIGELFVSTLAHEREHAGNINAMLKIVQ